MSARDGNRSVFALTSLQIGDLQSYLSELSLFLASESSKFYVLVDNRPWLKNFGSRPAHLWQFMVTKSRLSPFANSKRRKKKKKKGKQTHPKSNDTEPKKFRRWFRLIDAASLSQKRALLPVKKLKNSLLLSGELHTTLYGFIVFEVEWSSVRGINYLNELQTDTSLAIEAKLMKRWEFDGINQAAIYISSWFSGTVTEKQTLMEYLDTAEGDIFYDAKEDFSRTNARSCRDKIHWDDLYCEDNSPWFIAGTFDVSNSSTDNSNTEPHTPPPPKRRRLSKAASIGVEVQSPSGEQQLEEDSVNNFETLPDESDNSIESFSYKDVLILVRFNDPDLPSKLREIIVPDLRLLTLLESGLPSWVIFLQSYPGFCHLYRPWMCPLARALYVAISIITVMIGFYDLYKNVPVLKTTAAHLLGPLFEWIETWEMASRIKYLGTMLFLQNIEKSVRWILTVVRAVRSSLSVLTQPLLEPFMELFHFFYPLWNVYMGTIGSLCSFIWALIGTSFSLVMNFLDLLFHPLWLVLSGIWTIGTSVLLPIFWILGEIVYAPVRMILLVLDLVLFIWNCTYCSLLDVWMSISSVFQIASASKQTMTTYQVFRWSSLWNGIFSQVFRAVRSILNGLIAFLVACNRHRLSTYNYMQGFIHRGILLAKRSHWADRIQHHNTASQSSCKGRRKLHFE